MNFKTWFDTMLVVGAYPLFDDHDKTGYDRFDVIINVSDEYYPDINDTLVRKHNCVTHWFPMNEGGHDNGVNSIYGACYVMRLAEKNGQKVYLHCHAGIHRSRVVQAAYYFMRCHNHYEGYRYNGYDTAMHYDCAMGYLPPLREMESFLGKASNAHKRFYHENCRLAGGSLDDSKLGYVKVYKLPRTDNRKHKRNTGDAANDAVIF